MTVPLRRGHRRTRLEPAEPFTVGASLSFAPALTVPHLERSPTSIGTPTSEPYSDVAPALCLFLLASAPDDAARLCGPRTPTYAKPSQNCSG